MDLFDSATPEMKRMRNQKKDGTILEGLLATARDTEPAEVSYHPNGDLRASRDIFGPLSTENSPVCAEYIMLGVTLTWNRNLLVQRNARHARQLQPCPTSVSTLPANEHLVQRR